MTANQEILVPNHPPWPNHSTTNSVSSATPQSATRLGKQTVSPPQLRSLTGFNTPLQERDRFPHSELRLNFTVDMSSLKIHNMKHEMLRTFGGL